MNIRAILLLAVLFSFVFGSIGAVAAASTTGEIERAYFLNQESKRLAERGQLQEALDAAKEALKITRLIAKDRGRNLAADLFNIANLHVAQGDFFHAEPYVLEAIEVDTRVFGPDHPEVATDLIALAQIYELKRDFEKADQTYQRALDIFLAATDRGRFLPQLAHLYQMRARFSQDRGQPDVALLQYSNAKRILEATAPDQAAAVLNVMAEIELERSNLDAARDYLKRSLELTR